MIINIRWKCWKWKLWLPIKLRNLILEKINTCHIVPWIRRFYSHTVMEATTGQFGAILCFIISVCSKLNQRVGQSVGLCVKKYLVRNKNVCESLYISLVKPFFKILTLLFDSSKIIKYHFFYKENLYFKGISKKAKIHYMSWYKK